MSRSLTKLSLYGAYVIAGLLVLLPFHALVSVWVGSSYGIYEYVRLWKEVLLVGLFVVACAVFIMDADLRKKVIHWPVWWLVLAYGLLTIVLGLVAFWRHAVTPQALLYGLTVNLRFLLFFCVCLVLAARAPWLRRKWRSLLLIPASLVVGFGLLQVLVLPHDILRHVGYGPSTIAAYQTVDQKPDYVRVQSTTRGPNLLGAYIVIILAAAIVAFGSAQSARHRLLLGGLVVGSLVVLVFTYSRSAYIGAAVAGVAACVADYKEFKDSKVASCWCLRTGIVWGWVTTCFSAK
jgi:hypothetical protein